MFHRVKLFAAATAIIATAAGLSAAPAIASGGSTTDSCVELGPGPIGAQSCFASTSARRVDFAQVRMGRYSAGSYTLTCTESKQVFTKQGNVPTGGARSFFTQGLFGLPHPNCTISARAANRVKNRRASATVILIS